MSDKANNALKELHLRNKIVRLNKKLDTVEVEIMKYMRMPGWQAAGFSHTLISERENIKAVLKDTFNTLYGN